MPRDTGLNSPLIRRNVLLYGASVLAALALSACGGDDSDAGEEDALTVYSGRSEELIAPLLDQFSEETGIPVEARYGESAELAATLIEEGENSPADIYFSQDAGSLGATENEGLLSPLPGSILKEVDPRFQSPEGAWVGTSGRARVIAYNTDALSESDLPESVLDLTDPEWEGRVGWAPTNASFQAFVTAMRATEGEEATTAWLEGMVANGAVAYADNETARDGVAAGEVDLALINHYYVEQAREEEGEDYPVDVYFAPGGDVGSLVNVAGVGEVAGTDRSEEARRLIEFLLEPEAQEFFTEETKEYPLVAGIEPDPDLVPLDEIEQPDVDLSDLDDLQGTLELLEETGAL
ncbi:MAG: iron ABC transporter substrate-binding protein [Actinomycetota bacterium]|nr:iron ABC transporter substrate-binding protein [Actinomycetota bacterium]